MDSILVQPLPLRSKFCDHVVINQRNEGVHLLECELQMHPVPSNYLLFIWHLLQSSLEFSGMTLLMFVLCLVSGLSGNQDTFNAFKIFFLEKLHMSVSMDIVRTWCSRNNVFYCWNLSELGRHSSSFGDQKAQEEEQYIVHKHNFSGVLFKFVYHVFIIKRCFLKRCLRLLFHFVFQS